MKRILAHPPNTRRTRNTSHEISTIAGTATWDGGTSPYYGRARITGLANRRRCSGRDGPPPEVQRQLHGHRRGRETIRLIDGSMHIEGGTAIAYKREIENAADPKAKRQENRSAAAGHLFQNAIETDRGSPCELKEGE